MLIDKGSSPKEKLCLHLNKICTKKPNVTHSFTTDNVFKQGDSALIRSVLAVFFKTLFQKNSNFRTRRLKTSTFVANEPSYQLSKSVLTPRPSFLSLITRSKQFGSIYQIGQADHYGLLRQSISDINPTAMIYWPDQAFMSSGYLVALMKFLHKNLLI